MQLSYKNNTFQWTSHIKIDYVNNNSNIIEGIEITLHFCQALNHSKYRSSILFNVSWNINILFDINLDWQFTTKCNFIIKVIKNYSTCYIIKLTSKTGYFSPVRKHIECWCKAPLKQFPRKTGVTSDSCTCEPMCKNKIKRFKTRLTTKESRFTAFPNSPRNGWARAHRKPSRVKLKRARDWYR